MSNLGHIAAMLAVSLLAIGGTTGCENLYLDLDEIALNVGDGVEGPTDGSIAADDLDGGSGGRDSGEVGDSGSSGHETGGDTADSEDTATDTGTSQKKDIAQKDTGKDTGFNRPSYGCFEMTACATIECPNNHPRCMADILSKGPTEDQDQARELTGCIDANSCDFYRGPQCVESYCGAPRANCYDTLPKRSYDLSCSEVLLCQRQCNSAQCQDDCATRAGFSARGEFKELKNCAIQECRGTTGWSTDCIRDNCRREVRICMGCPLTRR